MTVFTAASRATGFVRIIVVAAVLGTTYLGNTYQTANALPNILFELLALGALQAVLVPTLVGLVDTGDDHEAEHVAGAILGLSVAVLTAVTVVGIACGPLLMRVLTAGVSDPAVRAAQVRLGSFFLWFFLPQMLLYAISAVATGVLNATHRFVVPVAAPILNNIVVIGTYLTFGYLRHGAAPSLDLTLAEKLVLAGGTTLGVVAFCSAPLIAVVRAGFMLRPNLDRRNRHVRALARQGLWAAVYLGLTQVLYLVVLLLANRVEGGVIAYQVALNVFMLPHALFAVPALTVLFPRLSREVQAAEHGRFAASIVEGIGAVAFFALPMTAVFLALAHPISRVILFGEGAQSQADVAQAVRAFAPGLLGFGAFLFITRAFYALGDAKTPTFANAALVGGGGALMVLSFAVVDPDGVAPLAASHSLAYLAGAVALLGALRRQRHEVRASAMLPDLARCGAAALAAWAVMTGVAAGLAPGGRLGALLTVVVAGVAGGGVYLGVHRLVRPAGGSIIPRQFALRGGSSG